MLTSSRSLSGRALDWATAMVQGFMPAKTEKRAWGMATVAAPEKAFSTRLIGKGGCTLRFSAYSPTEDQCQGGFIIDFHHISTIYRRDASLWVASMQSMQYGDVTVQGKTRLEAAMRCLVIAERGDSIEVPPELPSAQ